MVKMSDLLQNWRAVALLVGLPILMGLIGHFFVFILIRKIVRRTGNNIDDSLIRHCYRPVLWIVVFFVIRLIFPAAMPEAIRPGINHILSLFLIGTVSWLLIKSLYVLEDLVVGRFQVDVKDNLRARKIHTQTRVLRRIVILTP
jgi:hypothetical protein